MSVSSPRGITVHCLSAYPNVNVSLYNHRKKIYIICFVTKYLWTMLATIHLIVHSWASARGNVQVWPYGESMKLLNINLGNNKPSTILLSRPLYYYLQQYYYQEVLLKSEKKTWIRIKLSNLITK